MQAQWGRTSVINLGKRTNGWHRDFLMQTSWHLTTVFWWTPVRLRLVSLMLCLSGARLQARMVTRKTSKPASTISAKFLITLWSEDELAWRSTSLVDNRNAKWGDLWTCHSCIAATKHCMHSYILFSSDCLIMCEFTVRPYSEHTRWLVSFHTMVGYLLSSGAYPHECCYFSRWASRRYI